MAIRHTPLAAARAVAFTAFVFAAPPLSAQDAAAPPVTASTEVVVSAEKGATDPLDVPANTAVVDGDELRRTGARTVAEALQNVIGLDAGNGSDNGTRLANIGLWGLKEFDALLITVDGIPAGGPFNPNLSLIPVDEIDRIEIVKGPQGTLYGVSAFAGMIHVYTRGAAESRSVSLGGGSFGGFRGGVSLGLSPASDLKLTLQGSYERGDGWQERTGFSTNRLSVSAEKKWGATTLSGSLFILRDGGGFGSPTPYDGTDPIPGFVFDQNYAVGGARVDHHAVGLSAVFSTPIASGLKLENAFGVTQDRQNFVRSFVNGIDGDTATAEGVSLTPKETTVYDDVHLVAAFDAFGRHRLVGGAAITWGRTTADGTGFDLDLTIGPNPVVPEFDSIPTGDNRSFADRRTFLGLYARDEWTPVRWLTIGAGVRWDHASETLDVRQQEVGTPEADVVHDEKTDGQFSGDVSALVRLVDKPAGPLDALSLFVSARSTFKPAAPNLSEAESARILDPERVRAGEIGVKSRLFGRQLSIDLSFFHMNFENLVVSVPDSNGAPALTNAGEERFQGFEAEVGWRPAALKGLFVGGGYAHHDATYIHFSFYTPEGELRVVDGKRLELSPRDLWNLRTAWTPERGPSGFVAVRHQNQRPLNRRNRFYTSSFEEFDAGLGWEFAWGRAGITGRNLGDTRYPVTDSEIGDGQFYVSARRRFTADVTVRF